MGAKYLNATTAGLMGASTVRNAPPKLPRGLSMSASLKMASTGRIDHFKLTIHPRRIQSNWMPMSASRINQVLLWRTLAVSPSTSSLRTYPTELTYSLDNCKADCCYNPKTINPVTGPHQIICQGNSLFYPDAVPSSTSNE